MDKLTEWLKAERGRISNLAAAIGVTPSAISQWTEVPVNRVLAVEQATGIKREQLCPKLFREAVQ